MDPPDLFEPDDPQPFFLTAVVFELGLGLLALALGWLFGPDPRALLPRLDQFDAILWGTGLGLLAALPPLLLIWLIERLPLQGIRDLHELTEHRLIGLMSRLSYGELAVVSLCAGVGEELLFRGWLQASIAGPEEEWTPWRLTLAVVVAAVAFGIVHPITPTYAVLAGLIGIYFGVLLVVTGNLLVPILAHALFDAVQLVLAVRSKKADDASAT